MNAYKEEMEPQKCRLNSFVVEKKKKKKKKFTVEMEKIGKQKNITKNQQTYLRRYQCF
jgi:hypothetical protein